MDESEAAFVAHLEGMKVQAQQWEQRELTAEELADMRVPYVAGSGEDLVWKAIEVVFWKVPLDDPRMHELLTDGQRAVLALWWTCSEVGNGGLHQFFLNSTGYVLPEATAGAELLGEKELANALRRASSYLGDPYPRDHEQRALALAQLPDPGDAFWDEQDDAVYPTLERLAEDGLGEFISANPDQFFLPSERDPGV